MAQSVTSADVLRALSTIIDPDLGKNIVELGFVKDLRVDPPRVAFRIVLTTPACPVKARFQEAAERAVRALPGVEQVEVTMDAQVQSARRPSPQELIPGVRNTVAIASGKGGVGKSTVAVNLAVALQQQGARVGLLDADIYGPNVPRMIGAHEQPTQEAVRGRTMIKPITSYGVKVMSLGFLMAPDTAVIWRGPMVAQAVQQLLGDVNWGELDYLLIDLPPGTGDAQLTLSQAIPLTGAVIVATPQDVALEDVVRGIAMFQKVNVPILGVIENMSYYVCPHCHNRSEIFSHGGARREAQRFGVPFLGEVPLDVQVREGGDRGYPIVLADPDSPVAKAFLDLSQQLAARISIADYAAVTKAPGSHGGPPLIQIR